MRAEKEIRLRIDLLESQSSSIAKMLTKAIREHNEAAFAEYSKRLTANRDRIEELLWVLGEKAGQSILDLQVSFDLGGTDIGRSTTSSSIGSLSVRQVLEKLKSGKLSMGDLPSDVQAMVRKGAFELKHERRI